jgi:hypothetical protein
MEINIPKWRPRVSLTSAQKENKGEKGGTAHGPFPLGRPHLNVKNTSPNINTLSQKELRESQDDSKSFKASCLDLD